MQEMKLTEFKNKKPPELIAYAYAYCMTKKKELG